MVRALGLTLVVVVLLGIVGCDKDDGTLSGDPVVNAGGPESGSAVRGGSTKGPLQMAEVEALAFNANGDGASGAEIDTGETDAQTNVTGLFIPEDTVGLLRFDFGLKIRSEGTTTVDEDGQTVVEITSEILTTDLTTGRAPILHPFETILSAAVVLDGQRVFATPLSTMAVRIALANLGSVEFGGDGVAPITDAEVLRALANAQQRVRHMFGFGLIDDVDILRTPPLLLAGETDDPQVQDRVTQHRTAIEAMGALCHELASVIDTANAGSTTTSANDVFHALTADVTDGSVDGFELDGTLVDVYGSAGLAAVQSALATIDPTILAIPNEPNGLTVGDIGTVMKQEKVATDNDAADDTSVDANDSQATRGSISVSDIDGDGTPDGSDPDIDGDGVPNASDAFPFDSTEQADSDDDGIGDNADTDDGITAPGSNADLAGLSLSPGNLDQGFDPAVTSYTATAGFLASEAEVTATTADASASLTIDGSSVASGAPAAVGLVEGSNSVVIEVTSGDGTTVKTYNLDVTRQSAGQFAQQAYVKASNTNTFDRFGGSVAVSGDTLVVGARLEDSGATGVGGDQADNSSDDPGAVYVFVRDASGTWTQQAYIKASNADDNDFFGSSVAVSGDTLAVGAIGEDSSATGVGGNDADNNALDSGAAYVFTRDGSGTWSQQAYIKASNTELGDEFGSAVALSGDTLAVYSRNEDSAATGVNGDEADNSASNSGAVYVFTRDGAGTWSQQAYVKASNTDSNDRFGDAIALSGDTLAVTAPFESSAATGVNGNEADNSATTAGAAYVFTRDGGGAWSQQAYIKASNAEASDVFGVSVALSGDTLAVGADQEDSAATGVNGDEADNTLPASGAVYVFTRAGGGTWSQQAYIKASNPGNSDVFGRTVALSGDSLAVGATFEDSSATGLNGDETDDSASGAGAVYVFTRDGTGLWSQRVYVKGSNTESGDLFGDALALDGDLLAVGVSSEDSAATGVSTDGTGEADNSADNAGAVYLLGGVTAPSSNADLAGLSLTPGSLDQSFDPAVTNYTSTVAFNVASTDVTATTADAGATLTIDGTGVTSGTPFAVGLGIGSNVITIEVTAADGTTVTTYTLDVTRLSASSNADLAGLSLSPGSLDQVFDQALTSYTSTVGSSVTSTDVTATTADANATLTINGSPATSGAPFTVGLATGSNAVTIEVTAEDGSTVKTYDLDVTRLSSNADLISLSLDPGTLSPTFDPATTSYSSSVAFSVTSTDVTATTADANATLTINGTGVSSGTPFAVSLAQGGNAITIEVTAEDGTTVKTYNLDVTRLSASSNADLSDLRLDPGTLDQIFDPALTSYSSTVPFLVSTTDVIATTADANATLTINGISAASGAPFPLSLAEGGNAVTIDVTAEDGTTTQVYDLDITRESAAQFAQQAYVKASNTDPSDLFSRSVALDGDTLVVGASGEGSNATGVDGDQANNSLVAAGAVYVFTRDGNGNWSQQAYLKASNTESSDQFGFRVALSGDTLAVSAIGEDSAATGIDGNQADNSASTSGAVYVFTRDGGGNWTQQAYVKASNTDAFDQFGSSIALSGDTLAVGANGEASSATGINGDETDNSFSTTGAAYVFTRDGAGNWSQQAYIKASNAGASDFFGDSLALDGDTLVVGARLEDSNATGIDSDQADNSATDAGAAYVFTRDGGGNWSQQAYVKASNTAGGDQFGWSVAISGDTLAVGATGEDSSATGVGGSQVDNSATTAGAVYVFTRDGGGNWSQQAYVKASNTEGGDQFGHDLALTGDSLAVSALAEDSGATGVNGNEADNSVGTSGAVYLFARDGGGNWSQQAYVKASNTEAGDQFGDQSVALSGDTLAVGALREDSSALGVSTDGTGEALNDALDSGAVYVLQ